jgi:Ca-activated chloride channel family protein
VSNLLRQYFAQPRLLWLLAVLPALAALALWARKRRRRAMALLGGGLAFDSILPRRSLLRLLRNSLFFFGFVLLIVGGAGPQWGRDWGQSAAPGRDLMVVLDLSRSMLAEKPSRLARAQKALEDLGHAMNQRGGHRIGLVVFAGHAKLVCPLTHDYAHFVELVKSFKPDILDPALWPEDNAPSGTRIGEALILAVDSLDTSARGVQDILLVSDGDDPAHDSENERLKGARHARKHDVPVSTVGVGDPQTFSPIPLGDSLLTHDGKKVLTRLEEKPLQEIARRTGGTYLPLRTYDYPLGEEFFAQIASGAIREHGEDILPVYRQRYVWFLAPAFCLLALTMAVGDRRPRQPPRRFFSI